MSTNFNRGPVQAGPSTIAAGGNTSRSGAVFLAGMALVIANTALTPQGQAIYRNLMLTGGGKRDSSTNGLHLFGQLAVVLILTLLASFDNGLGTVALAVVIGMWLVFLVRLDPAKIFGAQ